MAEVRLCQCLTKNGQGPQCTRTIKDVEIYCAQHKKKCLVSIDVRRLTSSSRDFLETLSDYDIQNLCQGMLDRGELSAVAHLVSTNRHIRDICQPLLSRLKPKSPPEWDVDHLLEIPRGLESFPYLYSTSYFTEKPNREWILPPGWHFGYEIVRDRAYHKIISTELTKPIVLDEDQSVLSPRTTYYMLKTSLLESRIHNPITDQEDPPQIRKKGLILDILPILTSQESPQIYKDETLTTWQDVVAKMKQLLHQRESTKIILILYVYIRSIAEVRRCQCYKSQKEPNVPCPHKAFTGSPYCGVHTRSGCQEIKRHKASVHVSPNKIPILELSDIMGDAVMR